MNIRVFSHVFVLRHLKLTDQLGAINSLCSDGLHVGFVDLDDVVLPEYRIRLAQRIFDLSTCYVFQSSRKHFHLIFLDKAPVGFWIEVMKFIDDENTKKYQRFFVMENRACLRITPKAGGAIPIFKVAMKRQNSRYKSFAHWRFLKYVAGVDADPPDPTFDRNSKIIVEGYHDYRREKTASGRQSNRRPRNAA